ncbi:hypothetical protein GA0115253_101511, partial [Streptomyces sp. Termitarium-T10T-6]
MSSAKDVQGPQARGPVAAQGSDPELPARDRGADPEPPPPGGVLWSLSGDIRALLMLPAALTLQVAHPAVGAGVDE